MYGICKPFQVNFHVLPLKKPSKYFLFCATIFSSWGRSGRNCYLHIKLITPRLGSFICSSLILQGSWSDHCNLILKKGTPPWHVNVGGHPMESVSHGLRKETRWGGVTKLNKRAPMCQIFKELGTALTCLLWKIVIPHC
jgi:hypothetical protein